MYTSYLTSIKNALVGSKFAIFASYKMKRDFEFGIPKCILRLVLGENFSMLRSGFSEMNPVFLEAIFWWKKSVIYSSKL